MALAVAPEHSPRSNVVSEPVTGHMVARYLRIAQDTLGDWHQAGFLTTSSSTRRCYHSTALDNLLAKGACNFTKPPTFADLLAGSVRLLLPKEAAGILNINEMSLGKLVRQGTLAAVKYRHTYRYSAASVHQRASVMVGLTPKRVAHILGVHPNTVYRLESQWGLKRKDDKAKIRYTDGSVIALLRKLLPPNQHPEEWITDRLASTKPLLAIAHAVPSCHDQEHIHHILETGEVHYIHLATQPKQKRVLVSPDSLLAYLAKTELAFTTEDLARLFGVGVKSIEDWDAKYEGWRDCPVHDHYDGSLYRDCVVFLLKRYLTSDSSAVRWYNTWRRSKTPLLTTPDVAEILGVWPKTALNMVSTGRLIALRSPAGSLHYLRANVLTARKKRNAKRKAARSD